MHRPSPRRHRRETRRQNQSRAHFGAYETPYIKNENPGETFNTKYNRGPMRAIVLALFLPLAGCGVELEHGLDERQANEVASVLHAAGVSADKEPEEGQANAHKVSVARPDVGRALALP